MFQNFRRGSVIVQTNRGWFAFDLFSAYWLRKMSDIQIQQHISTVESVIRITIAERRWKCRRNLVAIGTLHEYLMEVKKM
jgi:hypothetical protein